MDEELAMLSLAPLITLEPGKRDENPCASSLSNMVSQGEFEEVLCNRLAESLLKEGEANSLDVLIKENVCAYLSKDDEKNVERELNVLAIAVSALQLFVQNNWVGPPSKLDPTSIIHERFSASEEAKKHFRQEIVNSLHIDGEDIYRLSVYPVYLNIARTILLECNISLKTCQTADWWLMRCLYIHQLIMEERSPTLKSTIMQLIEKVGKNETLLANDAQRETALCFHIEAGHLCYFYYEPSNAAEHFTSANKLSGLDIGLSGALGKRTRFQENEISQLILKVKRLETGRESGKNTSDLPLLPKDLALDDDTVLNKIKFQESSSDFVDAIIPCEQALVLALLYRHQKSQEGVGDLILEESLAYINCVLAQPQCWSVQTAALLLRSQWENRKSRAMERSMTQLEELVNQHKREEPAAHTRLHLVYTVNLPPRFIIEQQLGHFFMKVGAINAALEVFLRLEMWEEVIKCYISTGRQEKAENLIRDQLAIQETPELYCYLGDVLHEAEHYQKAWELSGGHSARAQRNLGYLYLNNEQFEMSLPCFEKSLKINALQVGVWFSYGCAALACEKFDIAAVGFRKCVILEPDNHEGWNNLASAYVRSGQKPKAFLTLQEALKCEFENWRIWENYLLVGTDIGEFEEVIRSYHRMIDLKNKHEDSQVLKVLAKAVTLNIDDAQGKPSGRLRSKFLELMGRITSKVITNGDIWRMYGEVLMNGEDPSQTERERALQYLQKSHRCNTQSLNWEKDIEKCKTIANQSTELATAYLASCCQTEDTAQATRFLSSARLMLKGVLAKIKQRHTDPVTKELPDQLVQPCELLEQELSKIVDSINERKTS